VYNKPLATAALKVHVVPLKARVAQLEADLRDETEGRVFAEVSHARRLRSLEVLDAAKDASLKKLEASARLVGLYTVESS
jgi:hypothetical protein